jgi:small-conductance mechanosensitive channel
VALSLRDFAWTIGALLVTSALAAIVRNHQLRRRLLVSIGAFGVGLLVDIATVQAPGTALPKAIVSFLQNHGEHIGWMLVVFGVVNGLVGLAFNSWSRDRPADATPAIVQDATVAAVSLLAAAFIFQGEGFLGYITGSAIIVGLALQETLGNLFAGLAIQVERPFKVGHWITAASHEGRVVEVTWRATRIRTKFGNLVSLPNSLVVKEAITNYSQPTAPTRLYIEVGAAYGVPPNEVGAAMMAAVRQVTLVLADPPPDVLLEQYADSSIVYRLRFWIDDFEQDENARDLVRRAVYYEFARRKIEIPWPIRVHYQRHEPSETPADRVERFARAIAKAPGLARLQPDVQHALADAAQERLFGDGECIVREGEAGASMFIVDRGEVAVTLGAKQQEVARIPMGGYFGEMSLMTGEPRSATVRARGDCRVLEIGAEAVKAYVTTHPEVIDHFAAVAVARRRELDQSRANAASIQDVQLSLAQRMRRFFGI